MSGWWGWGWNLLRFVVSFIEGYLAKGSLLRWASVREYCKCLVLENLIWVIMADVRLMAEGTFGRCVDGWWPANTSDRVLMSTFQYHLPRNYQPRLFHESATSYSLSLKADGTGFMLAVTLHYTWWGFPWIVVKKENLILFPTCLRLYEYAAELVKDWTVWLFLSL